MRSLSVYGASLGGMKHGLVFSVFALASVMCSILCLVSTLQLRLSLCTVCYNNSEYHMSHQCLAICILQNLFKLELENLSLPNYLSMPKSLKKLQPFNLMDGITVFLILYCGFSGYYPPRYLCHQRVHVPGSNILALIFPFY